MSDRPLQEAIDQIGGDGFDLIAAKPADGATTVTAAVAKDIGKPGGWSVAGAVQVVRNKVAAWGGLSWRPKR